MLISQPKLLPLGRISASEISLKAKTLMFRLLYIIFSGIKAYGYRVRIWKLALQHLANKTGLEIEVCHFPPGTSKWNKIEHRMSCHISQNW
jgi:Rhodopirellula transposase DDE domain